VTDRKKIGPTKLIAIACTARACNALLCIDYVSRINMPGLSVHIMWRLYHDGTLFRRYSTANKRKQRLLGRGMSIYCS